MTQEAGLENFWGMSAYAQESTAGDLKSKGATVLSAEEVKDLLSGATVRYEGPQYRTQAKLNADGTVSGSVQNRVGTAGGLPLMGKWNVNDQGRWCADVGQTPQGGTKFCRAVLKAAGKYYYVNGGADVDSRAAFELGVSK